jgi:hypothetical protein
LFFTKCDNANIDNIIISWQEIFRFKNYSTTATTTTKPASDFDEKKKKARITIKNQCSAKEK